MPRGGGPPRRAGLTWRSNSIHAFGLRDDHRPPYCLPSTILANKNKQVAASVVEALHSHFVSNLIRVSRNRCVAKDFDTSLPSLHSKNGRLAAELSVARYAGVPALSKACKIRTHHNDIFVKESGQLLWMACCPGVVQFMNDVSDLLSRFFGRHLPSFEFPADCPVCGYS